MNNLTITAQQTQDVDVFAEAATHFITHCKVDQPLWAASRLKDLNQSEDETRILMMELYNPRCANPSNDELEQAITATYNAQSAAPVHVTNSVTGTDPKEIGVSVGYDKTSHSKNANRFRQEFYPGKVLRCFDMEFYWYDGVSWVHAVDAALKAALSRATLNAEPNSGTIKGTFELMQSLHHEDSWNTYKGEKRDGLILMNNGILDVNTNELLPHTSEYLCSNLIPFDYEPAATAPSWEAFLQSTFEGDQERIDFVEEWIGYNLTRDYRYQKIAMLIGQQRSGKSTIMSILEAIQGAANYGSVDINGLGKDSKLHMLANKLSIVVPDASNPSRNEAGAVVGNMKSISGGDSITFDRKFKTAVTAKFPGKISIVTNNVLNLQDDSGALAGRMIICPFNKSFFGQEDVNLKSRLISEIPGIINRCITALKRLNTRGKFVEPSIAKQFRDDVQDRANPIFPFVREKLTVDAKEKVSAKRVYDSYRQWCVANGSRPLTNQAFKRALLGAVPGIQYSAQVRIEDKRSTGYLGVTCADPILALFETANAVNS